MPKVRVGDVYSYLEEEDGQIITGTIQDCTPYAEAAKEKHRSGNHGSKEMKHAGNLPFVAIEAYCNANGIDLREWMINPHHARAMLNDPALDDFRIWKGRV
jgi:hypothetical protein